MSVYGDYESINLNTGESRLLGPGEFGSKSCSSDYEEHLARTQPSDLLDRINYSLKAHPSRSTGGGRRVIRKTNTF